MNYAEREGIDLDREREVVKRALRLPAPPDHIAFDVGDVGELLANAGKLAP